MPAAIGCLLAPRFCILQQRWDRAARYSGAIAHRPINGTRGEGPWEEGTREEVTRGEGTWEGHSGRGHSGRGDTFQGLDGGPRGQVVGPRGWVVRPSGTRGEGTHVSRARWWAQSSKFSWPGKPTCIICISAPVAQFIREKAHAPRECCPPPPFPLQHTLTRTCSRLYRPLRPSESYVSEAVSS